MSANRFLFIKSVFYFIALYSLYVCVSLLPFRRIFRLLTALLSSLLFLYGIIQKLILFPILLENTRATDTQFAQLVQFRLASGRIFGIFSLPTLYAMICGVLILFCIHFLLQPDPKKRLLWTALIGLGLLNLYYSVSFGALFSLSAALFLYLYLSKKISFKLIVPLAMAASLFFFLVTALRFSEVRSLKPLKLRLSNWFQAIRLIQERPLLGWGLGNYEVASPVQIREGEPASIYAHSFPLQLTAELGLPLAAILLICTFYWFRRHRSAFFDPATIPFTSALFLVILFNLTDIGIYFLGCGVIVAFCCAQIVPYQRSPNPLISIFLILGTLSWAYTQYAADCQRKADLLFSRAETRQAETLYKKSLKLVPWSYKALSSLAILEFDRGNLDRAVLYARNTLKYAPYHGSTHYILSKLAFQDNMVMNSLYHAKMAVTGNRRNSEYRTWYETLDRIISAQLGQTGN